MRLIDADAVLDKSYWLETYVPTRVVPLRTEIVHADELRDAPTIDAIPVVRCRECIHRDRTYEWHGDYNCSMRHEPGSLDFFCGDGQRREVKAQ